MKIAISSAGKELSDQVSELFGRCPYFIIVEMEKGLVVKREVVKNRNEDQASGAGMAAAKFLAERDVDVAIAKTIGPRAMDVLRQFKIEIHEEAGVIEDVLGKFAAKQK